MNDFSPPPLRAPTACVACNKKKVRCIFDGNPDVCVNCQRHQWPCSRRERKRKRAHSNDGDCLNDTETVRRRRVSWDEPNSFGPIGSARSPCPSSEYEQDRNQCRDTSQDRAGTGEIITPESNPYSSASTLSFMARSRYFDDAVSINEEQARSYPEGDADGPTEDDIQLLRLQGAFDLPPRAIREGLINTFMERCSPWMPIIERSLLEESGSQKPSILLLQSIFVAASRVTSAPGVTAYASLHQFYRRAKALFWSGYERNPVTVVAAVCILHWYNPEGPEHVSTNTSGFWRYVGVGLAHQIGLHKEPTNKRDAALRRRLWWTLYARDCCISAGQGRPLAVDLEDCEVAPPCPEDFHDSSSNATLFIAYVEISSILGHLTEYCRRKTLTREARQNLENRLYRWTRDLPPSLRLFCSRSTSDDSSSPKRTLARYNFEARQLHIPYFTCLAIMCRPNPGESASPGVLLASSFIAGIYEDFLARDEIQFLSPVFTFHLLAAGIGLLSCNNVPSHREKAAISLESIYLALEELAKRWSSAKGSLRALKSIAEKQRSMSTTDEMLSMALSRDHQPFFEGFGPDLSWAWSHFMDLGQVAGHDGRTNSFMVAGIPELGNWAESRAPDAISSDEYRPLTTILDRNEGLAMGDMSQDITGDFFNQYQGMGDWLFKDLEWNGEIA
ncbi:Transcription factor [Penicillium concentricum]|uniref:Transcription factor n=1 Tax=Penicillium concentricum TaxID=293559 RepID=A0A9W9RKC3_9EURO|nr:Transcription factor [Penicillium concentricum]KAJ5360854.1 Transcription factor [Penicillium concentricum]